MSKGTSSSKDDERIPILQDALSGAEESVAGLTNPYVLGDRLEAIVARHARLRPHAVAVQQGDHTVTYEELVEMAERVAAGLRDTGFGEGDHVPVLMPRSPEFVAVLVGVLRAGASYIACDPRWPASRVRSVMERSGARTVVDGTQLPRWLDADPDPLPTPESDGRAPACVFYTSGSTGDPKGALSPHRGTIRTLVNYSSIPLNEDTVFLQAAPVAWDGLSLEMWAPLLNGGRCVLVDRDTQVLDIDAWEAALYLGVNSMWLTSSLFNLFAEERSDLFQHLRLLLVGGERVSPSHVRRALTAAPGLHIVNGYGPAENTIFTTTHVIRQEDVAEGVTEVPIGRPVPRTSVILLDDKGNEVPRGTTGELAVGGDGLATGYLDDPQETARRFFQRDGQSWYRTGDLAVADIDGTLRFRGRSDRQFKVRGLRIEPGEVESVLERHPSISSAYVLRMPGRSGQLDALLGLLYTSSNGQPIDRVEMDFFMRKHLIEAMRPTLVAHLSQLPLNVSGKVDNVAAAQVLQQQVVSARTGPSSPLVQRLCHELSLPALTDEDDLLAAGITSLDAVRIAAWISTETGRRVKLSDVYQSRSVGQLMRAKGEVTTQRSARLVGAEANSHQNPSPLSHAQLRFWLAELAKPGLADNMLVLAYEIVGPLRVGPLRDALRDVQRFNPVLRTIYEEVDELPVQRVLGVDEADLDVDVSTIEASGGDPQLLASRITEAWWDDRFELETRPPLRARLCRVADNRHLLCLHIHHIAFDGWSEHSFMQQLAHHYRARAMGGEDLEAPVRDHRDEVLREQRNLPRWRKELLPFWREQLRDPPEPFLDAPPAGAPEATRRELICPVESSTVLQLGQVAESLGVPLASTLIAATAAASSTVFSASDLCIGTVSSGRASIELKQLVGYFVNPLALTLRGLRQSAPEKLVAQAGRSLVAALDHSELPFDDLVQALSAPRGRHPWFQAWSVLQIQVPHGQLDSDTTLTPIRLRPPRTSIELMVEAIPRSDGGWDVVQHGRNDNITDAQAAAVLDELARFWGVLVGKI